MAQIGSLQLLPYIPQRFRGKIRPGIPLTIRGEPQQEQSRAAADFQYALRPHFEDAGDGLLDLLSHLLGGNWLAGITVVPSGYVEGGISVRCCLFDNLIERRLPE